MQVVNWKMAAHPINWVVIFLMLVIAGIAGHLILSYFGIEPKQPDLSGPSSGQKATPPPAASISSYAGRG